MTEQELNHASTGRVLVTGATGMLGRYVMKILSESGAEVIVADREVCDLNQPAMVYDFVKRMAPTAILHLGAETDVDLCEREPARAGRANHLSTDAIAKAASEHDAWLLYISTSNIFGGEGKISYNELDMPSPTNYYGRSKLQGELCISRRLPDNHLLIRAGWMIGGGAEQDHKFVGKMVKLMRDRVPVIRAVVDKFGSITPASLLAAYICESLYFRRTGTMHYSSAGVITRLDVAHALAELLSFDGDILGVASSHFPLSAPRPQSEGMESIYLPKSRNLPNAWKVDLANYITEFTL
jgi:dTDP-4-dehydrorhamnose reductase